MLDVLNAAAVAALLGCKVSTIEDRARRGDLPGLLFGDGGWVFPATALAARLNELAVEEASRRRAPQRPSGVLHDVNQPQASTPKRARRAPPALPSTA